MAVTLKLGSATFNYFWPSLGSPRMDTRSDFSPEFHDSGTKVSGAFLNLPGGVFRRATALAKISSVIEPQSPQILRGKYTGGGNKGKEAWIVTNPGGYRGDHMNRNAACSAMVSSQSITDGRLYPEIPTLMRNQAVTEALLSLADEKAGIGEDLATFMQTVRLLKNPLSSLVSGVKKVHADKSLKPYLRESARSLARKGPIPRAAEKYLEYVYGWKPLMQDIFGIIELAKEQGVVPLLLKGEGVAKQRSGMTDFFFSDGGSLSTTSFTRGVEDATVRCNIWARMDPNYAGLRALNQLGLLNPASLAWELVPWSFVVDWVVPIGATLQALTAPVGLIFVDGTVSNRVKAQAWLESRQRQLDSEPQFTVQTNQPATSKWQYQGYRRSTLSGWPRPGFWYNEDPLGFNNEDSDRGFKALALSIIALHRLTR